MTLRPGKFSDGWWQVVSTNDNVCAACQTEGLAQGEVDTVYIVEWEAQLKANTFRACFCNTACLFEWTLARIAESNEHLGYGWLDLTRASMGLSRSWQPLEENVSGHPCRGCGQPFEAHPHREASTYPACEAWY